MPKLELTTEELDAIKTAVDTEIRSTKRQQMTSKTPQLKVIYEQHEQTLNGVKSKLLSSK